MASQSNNSSIVTGLFRDRQSAECAYRAISSRGYDKDDVNLIMSDETRQSQYVDGVAGDSELGSKALEGTATGAGIGGTLGAVLGAIAAIGTSILLPGLGLLVAGPLAGALVGAGAGGLTGGLLGALVGSGIPEEHAAQYETGIKSGGTVLGVNPRNAEDAAYFEREFANCGGANVYSSGSTSSRTTTTTAAPVHNVASTTTRTENVDRENVNRSVNTGDDVIPIIEEELQVGKREVEGGGVRVQTHVTERPVEEHVTLREENVKVERHPVNRDVTDSDLANFKEGEINVTTRAEEAVVNKQARVVEEVEIGKQVTEREETVRDTVRRTDVEVDETDTNSIRNNDINTRKTNS